MTTANMSPSLWTVRHFSCPREYFVSQSVALCGSFLLSAVLLCSFFSTCSACASSLLSLWIDCWLKWTHFGLNVWMWKKMWALSKSLLNKIDKITNKHRNAWIRGWCTDLVMLILYQAVGMTLLQKEQDIALNTLYKNTFLISRCHLSLVPLCLIFILLLSLSLPLSFTSQLMLKWTSRQNKTCPQFLF